MEKPENTGLNTQDDSDADAFAVLSLLVIIAAGIVYYINH